MMFEQAILHHRNVIYPNPSTIKKTERPDVRCSLYQKFFGLVICQDRLGSLSNLKQSKNIAQISYVTFHVALDIKMTSEPT